MSWTHPCSQLLTVRFVEDGICGYLICWGVNVDARPCEHHVSKQAAIVLHSLQQRAKIWLISTWSARMAAQSLYEQTAITSEGV